MLTLSKNQLKAALTHAAKGDVRYYLNSVLIECCANGDVHIVATDGHRMFAGLIHAANVQWTAEPKKGPWSFIIPRAAIEAALKEKVPALTFSALPDGRYTLGNALFSPVGGRFPDWRRIAQQVKTAGTEQAQFSWDLVNSAQDALRFWFDKKNLVPHFRPHGNAPALFTGPDCTAFCVVMPFDHKKDQPVTPCPYLPKT